MFPKVKEPGEATFFLEGVRDYRFPYRPPIGKGDEVLLLLRVQDRWPVQKGKVFFIRQDRGSWISPHKELERVPILLMKTLCKRLSLVLDRAQRKRCHFSFPTRTYTTRDGERANFLAKPERPYKPQHEGKAKCILSLSYQILVEASERYSWKFQGRQGTRQELSV